MLLRYIRIAEAFTSGSVKFGIWNEFVFVSLAEAHSYMKDVAVVASLVIAIGGCWFAYAQHKYSQHNIKRMIKDMESLQKAEESLTEMQNK